MSDQIKAEIARRLALLAALYVKTENIVAALSEIQNLRETGFRGVESDAYCYFVVGPSASGKTRLLTTYCQDDHAKPNGDLRPVVRVRVPSTVKSVEEFLAAILIALGTEPFFGRHRKSQLEQRILRHLERRKTELILLEEVNHLVDRKRGNLGYWGADAIKTLLLDTAKIPVVMSGICVSEHLFSNSQLLSRRRGVLRLFAYDWKDPGHRAVFQRAIEAFELACRFPRRLGLADRPYAERIHRATGGIIGNLCKLFEVILIDGIKAGKEAIDLEMLAVAHAKIEGGGPGWKNVFTIAVLPPIVEPDESRVTKLYKNEKKGGRGPKVDQKSYELR